MDDYVDSVLDPLASTNSKKVPDTPILDAIVADAEVKTSHKALLRLPPTLEKALYGPTVQLLNSISAAYYTHGLRKGDAVIFTLRPHNPPGGDYLALEVKPDVCGFRGSPAELLLALANPKYISLQPWSVLLEVGELKRVLDAGTVGGQLKTYLTGLKRYRPDLTTVHGFSLERGRVKLASLNPCGMIESDPIPWDKLEPWIAHVVQVYHSLDERDIDMQYCVAQQKFHRWDIRKAGTGVAVMPFHVGTAPGRTTFACFEIGRLPKNDPGTDPDFLAKLDANFDTGIVEGFWKLSWQRTTSRLTEKQLLDMLHKDGWVPGLVRHHPDTSVRGADSTAVFHLSGEDESIGRVKNILHLGSIGQPLSQCETAGDLLDVMYDLIEVHAHVCELGVLHRDVSYFNVMCKPQHYLTTHPVLGKNCVLERPCIKKIFGDENGQPCVLLTDLDHATTFIELETGAVDATKTVGTPMFVSAYLAAHSAERRFNYKPLGDLLEALEAVEKTQLELFDRAFPNGDGDFIQKFKQVVAAERIRSDKKALEIIIPEIRHDWRHDAESIYWIFLYSFARALPLGAVSKESNTFKILCAAMLKHSTDMDPETTTAREIWVEGKAHNNLFAPALKRLELLFEHMADYWTIPWHLYCGEGGIMAGNRNHVHAAFRRLILWFKLDGVKADTLLVCLSTSAPRITTVFDDIVREFVTPTGRRAATGLTTTRETRFSVGQKRKAEALAAAMVDSDSDDVRDAKRTKPSCLLPAATTSNDALFAANDTPAPPQPELEALLDHSKTDGNASTADDAEDVAEEVRLPKDEPVEPYDAAAHCHAKSAKALRSIFWKDRSLWFGRGT